MQFEHLALNVPDPRAMGRWYVENLQMRLVRSWDEPPYGRFLADATGRVVLELFCDPNAPVPDYRALDPQTLHVAFATANAAEARRRLEAAGAALVSDRPLPSGTTLIMMRDPWGVALQLCQRPEPM